MRRIGLAGALLLALIGAGSAQASEPRQRIHLGETADRFLHWTVDPADVGEGVVERECGYGDRALPWQTQVCGGATDAAGRFWRLTFFPGSLFDAPVQWGPDAPIRFRIALTAVPLAPLPYTVHLTYEDGNPVNSAESAPATEVAPGVWEGELTSGGPIDQANPRRLPQFGVSVRTESRGIDLALDPSGTWIDLPAAVPATSLGGMSAESPAGASTIGSAHHRFTVTDDRYSLRSFGPLRGTHNVQVDVPAGADVIAWAESRNSALLSDPGDPRSHWRPGVSLRRGDTQIGDFSHERVGASDLAAGPLTVRASQALWGADGAPYTLHVLVLEGPRTLKSMEWTFAPTSASAKTPVAGICGSTVEPVPISGAVTSYGISVGWESDDPLEKWSPAWRSVLGDNACYPPALGRRVTLVAPGRRLAYVGYGASQDSAFAASNTTTFTIRVDLTHRPF